jgi:hypothetical protein
MSEETVKNCPLCKKRPEIICDSKDGTRFVEVVCSNEHHIVAVFHLTRSGALRRWNDGIERMEEEVIYQEKGI